MKHEELTLDQRTAEELYDRIEELAASYTQEWCFDRENPDIGSTLAMIYAGQMAENIRRLNQLPEKYHTEFVNLLDLTLKPACPASGIALVELLRGTVPGVPLPHGSRLMADGADSEPILFETMGDVYLTNARITDVLSLSGTRGRILPLRGGPATAALTVEMPEESETAEQTVPESEELMPETASFDLFDYEEQGVEKNALLLYHHTLFGGDASTPICVVLTAPDGTSLAAELTDPARWRWSYYDGTEFRPFEQVGTENAAITLRRGGASAPVRLNGTDYHAICLEAMGPVKESLTVGDIRMASVGEPAAPAMILHNGEAMEAEECLPFGDTASLFDECYLCDDAVFSQQGAEITLAFRLESRKKLLRLTPQQELEELKVIKRKPRAVQYDTAHTAPERISMEYFNGQAWCRLPCSTEWSTLFDGTKSGAFRIAFRCPADWVSVPVNGYTGRSLRLRVTQADNCYLLPCEHTMPLLRDVRLAYAYTGEWKQPQQVRTICGTQTGDPTDALLNGKGITAFAPLPYPAASLYLGFDRPLEGAPISLLFDVEKNIHFRMEPVHYEYSTRNGFRPMKVVDGTGNFSASGTVLFMPPADFAPLEVEGVRRRWLRLRGGENAAQGYHARIKSIQLNAVNIRNQETLGEETFYVETSVPNLKLPLSARNILSAEVFVSELGQHSRQQMRRLQEEHPEDVRVDRDPLGEVTAFYVRWTEVDTFDRSEPKDRHYMIDRVRNLLVFGDGVHVRIPQAGRDAAILVRPVSCDGTRGNVPAGAVDRFYGNVMYVQSVSNPVATHGGSDLESLDNARRRGAELLSGRGRLISEQDFVRAVKTFSGSVEKVKCAAGQSIDGGEDPALVTIAVMTQDYDRGAYAFHTLCEPLRRHLLACCEAAMAPEHLVISEPMYVEISVSVWVKTDSAEKAFEIQSLVLDSLREFLDPLPRAGHTGWEIGVLPSEGQIKMLLQSLRFSGYVEQMVTVARYVDRAGVHETGLDELSDMPFAIGVSGKHQVYMDLQ